MEPGKFNRTQPIEWSVLLLDTLQLSTEEFGAYMLLIGAYWSGAKPLPDDDISLATVCRVSLDRWGALKSRLAPFWRVEGGFWWHKRIDADLAVAWDLAEARKDQTAAARAARKPNVTDNVTEKIYQAYPRKVGKPMALRAIGKALASGVDAEWLLEVTKLWADSWKHEDIAFCPYPATWYNQERYNDDFGMQLRSREHVNGNGAPKFLLSKELDGVEDRIRVIRSQYTGLQSWCEDDKNEIKKLKARRTDLRQKLGLTV